MWKWILRLWQDNRGDDNPAGAGDAPAADKSGQGDSAGAGDGSGDGSGGGQAGQAPASKPLFGEFGDDPIAAAPKMFETLSRLTGDFDNFKSKAGNTEKNLATLRKTLETSGIRINETGQLELIKPQGQEKKVRFTPDHQKLFDQSVLEAIRNLFQDMFEDSYGERERMSQEKQQQVKRFMSEAQEVEELMLDYFPQLKEGDSFNQAFYDRATQIWEEQYGKNRLKQLSAALRAAKELNIIPQQIAAAKKEGFIKGKENKRILAPVGGSGGPAGGGGGGKVLSREEYLALTPDKKTEYDKWRLEHPDAK
jgi:hypothetical protein